jgi:ubiquinone/menaquinone biosynthesis C-methylase UbiE
MDTMSNHARGQVATHAAQVYEEFFVPALFAQWPMYVLHAAHVVAGDTVLDVGCGTGVLARQAATQVGPRGSVVGVDINEGMLAVARRQAPELLWQWGDAESLPFDDSSFDRVVSQFSLMFYGNPSFAIAEMNRVLRPTGAAAVAVWGALEETPGYAVMARILEKLFGAAAAYSLSAPFALGNLATLEALFTRAGLHDISIQTITGKARFPSVASWLYTEIRGWTLATVIDDEDYTRLKRYAPNKLAQFVLPDGSVEFEVPAHIVSFHSGHSRAAKR